jgi:hypothetical protein
MKRAHTHREYRNVRGFEPPEGVVSAEVDVATGKLGAGRSEVYIAGTQPVEGVSGQTQVFGWDLPEDPKPEPTAAQPAAPADTPRRVTIRRDPPPAASPAAPAKPADNEKKGLWGRLRSIFK